MIERAADLEVCGMAANGREALELAGKLRPEVLVLDLTMPEMDGMEVVRQMRRTSPKTRILVFSALQSEKVVEELFRIGVKSYIRKSDDSEHLVAAIRLVAQDKPYFTPGISEILFARILNANSTHKNGANEQKLSSREREIVRLIAEGRSNKSAATELNVSTRTIETHRAAVMRKLRITSVADLVRYAIRNGIVEP